MGKRINQTSQHTFTDDPAGTLRYQLGIEPVTDDTYLRNHIEVNGSGGVRGRTGSGVAIDQASADDDYGIIVHRIDSELKSGGERQALAEYQAILYAQPAERLPELPLNGARDPAAMWPVILGLDLGVAITVQVFATTAAPKTLELNVEGIHHRCLPGGPWTTEVATSPRNTAPYLQIGHATLGKVENVNRIAP